jgi:Phage tail lysozyme
MHVVRGRFLAINLPLCTKVKWLFRLTTPSGSVWPVRSSPRWVAILCRQIQLGKPAPPNGCAFTHDLGLTKEQAAGSVGNLSVESDYFRKFHENRQPWQRGGIGDVQWTGKRRLAYERWATENGADPSKLETMKQAIERKDPARIRQHMAAIL